MKSLLSLLAGAFALAGVAAITPTVAVAADATTTPATTAKAILAGGCFWCLEHDFRALPGVVKAVSGYSGGSIANPTYQNYHDVSDAAPVPHTEVVEITYDTSKVSYAKLLDYYFRHVDPTDGGGQFCDRGPAYAPVIFTANEAEKGAAKAKSAEVAKLIKAKVAVEIRDAKTFWPAEDYHQDYAEKNSIKYKFYRWNCGRDQRVAEVWGSATN
jgi:peptide-methionine (S)-S-oxide reductase